MIAPFPVTAHAQPERGVGTRQQRVLTLRQAHVSARCDTSQRAGRPAAQQEVNTMAKKASLRPLGDRVVVKPVPRDEKTASGIILPDTAQEKPQEGEVVSVGPGRILDDGKREPIDVKVGDRVLHAKYAGTEFKLDGAEYLIVGAKDILAVVE